MVTTVRGFISNPRVFAGLSNSRGGAGLSSLRVLRLLRVFRSMKLLRQVEGLNKIVNIVLKVSNSPLPLLTNLMFISVSFCCLWLKTLSLLLRDCCRLCCLPV